MSHYNATQWSPWLTVERPSPVIPGPWSLAVSVEILVKLESEANTRGRWQGKHFRGAKVREVVGKALVAHPAPPLPIVARITRISPSRLVLDADNLVRSGKALVDVLCVWLDCDDSSDQLRFVWRQERGPTWAARIEVFAHGAVQP